MAECKVVVLGAGKTGKTVLIIRFWQGIFPENYSNEDVESVLKTVEVGGHNMKLDIVEAPVRIINPSLSPLNSTSELTARCDATITYQKWQRIYPGV